jgi:hypothetical protein
MDFRRIEKSDPSQTVQRVGEQNNRKRDENSEEFRRMMHEQRKAAQEADEDKVELSEDASAQQVQPPNSYPLHTPRYTAADAATSLALLELQVFTAPLTEPEKPEGTAEDEAAEAADAELLDEDELLEANAVDTAGELTEANAAELPV